MTKLNTTSANLNVINDEQLTQVVGGHGHRNHRREYNRYCQGRSDNRERGCYGESSYGCYGDSSYGGGSSYSGSSYGSDSSSSSSSDSGSNE